jgi:hypothetical protein
MHHHHNYAPKRGGTRSQTSAKPRGGIMACMGQNFNHVFEFSEIFMPPHPSPSGREKSSLGTPSPMHDGQVTASPMKTF